MKQLLTKKQSKTLKYIKQFSKEKGYVPNLKEIGKHFRLSSKSSPWSRVHLLEKNGWIKTRRYYKRSIVII